MVHIYALKVLLQKMIVLFAQRRRIPTSACSTGFCANWVCVLVRVQKAIQPIIAPASGASLPSKSAGLSVYSYIALQVKEAILWTMALRLSV